MTDSRGRDSIETGEVATFVRRVLVLLFSMGIAAVLVLFGMETADGSIRLLSAVLDCALLGVFCLGLLLLWLRPALLGATSWALVLSLDAVLVLHLCVEATSTGSIAFDEAVTTLLPWFPLGYIVPHLVLHRRQAVSLSLVLSSCIAIFAAFRLLSKPDPTGTEARLMAPVLLSHVILLMSLNGLLRLKDIIQAQQERVTQLGRLAETDPLTSLSNRRACVQAIGALADANTGQATAAILMLDIDHFKRVNDEFGHDAGDRVLVGVSAVLQRCLRASDMAGRWGGEEFVVIASDSSQAGTMELAERLRSKIAEMTVEGLNGVSMQVTTSVGIAFKTPSEMPALWLNRADKALYIAKSRGRNCCVSAEATGG